MKVRVFGGLICLVLVLAGCGGGGGGSGGFVLSIQSLQVTSQNDGPLSPFGTTLGSDAVVITGTGFVNGLSVRFGATLGNVTQVTTNQILVETPFGPAGFADVAVTNPGGESETLAATFQFVVPPVILALVALTGPTTGENRAPIEGNETIRLQGLNFKDGLTIAVDGDLVVSTFVDEGSATFPAPDRDGDQASDVTLINPEGLSVTLARGLIYTQEFSLAAANNVLSGSRARHLFRRAGFSAPPRIIDAAVNDGLIATLNGLVDFATDARAEADALTIYGGNPPPIGALNARANKEWWIHLLLKNTNVFQERLAYFLHDHFATSEEGFSSDFRWTLHRQINLFRRFSLGKGQTLDNGEPGLGYDWRQLIIEISKDQAMLDWLDGRVSRVGAPNENFPRELMELFTLGEGNNYTESDIQEIARAFTGFRWGRLNGQTYLSMEYVPSRHDGTEKTIFGVTGKFGYDSVHPFKRGLPDDEVDPQDEQGGVIALLFGERAVEASQFICRKLFEFFVYEGATDEMVEALASDLRRAGTDQWNLKPILVRILRSKAMYSSRAMKGQVRNPIEFVIGFLRTTEVDLSANRTTNVSQVRLALVDIGQIPINPPDVSGWPTGVAWLGAQAMLERINFLNTAVSKMTDVENQIEPLIPPRDTSGLTPTQLINHVANVLDVQLSGNAIRKLEGYLLTELVGDTLQPIAFAPRDDDYIRTKVQGLLYQIAQYHDGHQN